MANAYLKIVNTLSIYHQHAASNDMPDHNTVTTDTSVHNLKGAADFQIEADSDQTYTTFNITQDSTTQTLQAANGGVDYTDFVKGSVEGGVTFTSTEIYMKELLKL